MIGYDRRIINEICRTRQSWCRMSGRELLQRATDLRNQASGVVPGNHARVLVEAFVLASEAVRRTEGVEPDRGVLHLALGLTRPRVIETNDPEIRRLVVALPIVWHAMRGHSVHFISSDAFSASMHHDRLQPVLEKLGLRAALIDEKQSRLEKREVYRADLVCAPAHELAYDYLRDRLRQRTGQVLPLASAFQMLFDERYSDHDRCVCERRDVAIVDDADRLMLDQAITPWAISQPAERMRNNSHVYRQAMETARLLRENHDYLLTSTGYGIAFTEMGLQRIRSRSLRQPIAARQSLGCNRPWYEYVQRALVAERVLQRNRHYVVRDQSVLVVDPPTGGIHNDRTWRDGLYQAVQAKEGVDISEERQPAAQMTRAFFFSRYEHLAGIARTLADSQRDIRSEYGLRVVRLIGMNQPCPVILPTHYCADLESKNRAVLRDLMKRYYGGQPVLIGTRSIAQNVELSHRFEQIGLPHQSVDGLDHAVDAEKMKRAGLPGVITLAANQAASHIPIALDHRSVRAGGLHVVGYQRYELHRLDMQLACPAVRDEAPVTCRFYVSPDEVLISRDPQVRSQFETLMENVKRNRTALDRLVRRVQDCHAERMQQSRNEIARLGFWMDESLRKAS